jgi:hypothetical protein
VDFGNKFFIQQAAGKVTAIDAGLDEKNLLGKKRRYLGIGEDATRCFNKSGGSIRSSIP